MLIFRNKMEDILKRTQLNSIFENNVVSHLINDVSENWLIITSEFMKSYTLVNYIFSLGQWQNFVNDSALVKVKRSIVTYFV